MWKCRIGRIEMIQIKIGNKFSIGIVFGLLLIMLPAADAANITLYDYTFLSDNQSWIYANTTCGTSCTITRGWNSTDGIPPGSLYYNQSQAGTTQDRTTQSAWSSPNLTWSNRTPTSATVNFSYKVMVTGSLSSVTISAYIIKTDSSSVLVYQGSAITSNTSWVNISVPVGTNNFTAAGNYKIRLNGTLFTTNNPAKAEVRWDTVNLTFIWQTYIPPTPINLANTTGNFWVNYSWTNGTGGNITNSYNVSHNNLWSNNTIKFRNNTVGPHNWSNITVYAYNSSSTGQMSETPALMNTQVANNVPVLGSIGPKTVTAGQDLIITISATDADSDPLTNATNVTFGSFTSPNVYTWSTSPDDFGTHLLEFNTSDTYGGVDGETITVTVNAATYIPPTPTIIDIFQGNFWINYSWIPGVINITDSYNVSVNGEGWTNGTTTTYTNTSVSPHGWSNITIFAFNNSGSGSLSLIPETNNTQIANNIPVQTLAANFAMTAGKLLTFTVSATDADSDPLTFSTNATNGTLNQSTGVYYWMPSSTDSGDHFWFFRSDDGYGGNATNTTTITVTGISGTYINGTVRSGGNAIEGVKVSTNTTISITTDAYGFYSLPVTSGAYELTAVRDPEYYTNNSVTAIVVSGVLVEDIELLIKPTGTISGNVAIV
jgi:hypothetical protein